MKAIKEMEFKREYQNVVFIIYEQFFLKKRSEFSSDQQRISYFITIQRKSIKQNIFIY